MKIFKKNQIVIYVVALMLVTAGYLNYMTNDNNSDSSVETSIQMESNDDTELANIGDAKLVNSNDVLLNNNSNENNSENTSQISENNTTNENKVNSIQNNTENITKQQNGTVQTNATNSPDDYFTKSKLERDTMYSQMLETYEKVINSSNSLETQKQTATQEITKINETKNSIMICENLIKTKGFDNSVIFVNGKSVNVIIGASEIKQEEIAQIQNIISREMNVQIENIHITNK